MLYRRFTNNSKALELTPSMVRRGDVVTIGGRSYEVTDLRSHPDGRRSLLFTTGEVLTLRLTSRLVAVRFNGRW